MARIRNIVMEGATGRLGSMVLTQRAGTGTVARTLAPEVSNPKSDAQQTRRVKWANLVNIYKVSKGWMAKAFENKASNQSDYNKFMSLNANTTKVSLTKDQASQGGVIAGPYTISQGSLPSVVITKLAGGSYATNINLGNLTITEDTTVSQFSTTVLANNAWIREGYQISFISYQQLVNGVTGVPYVLCGWYEVTINKADERLLNDVMPTSFAAATVTNNGKYLGTGPSLSSGCFAYVVSTRSGGKILVSTQQLTLNNNTEYDTAITREAEEAAIASYGTTSEVFLAPGYAGGGQTQTGANGIVSAIIGSSTYLPGTNVISVGTLKSASGVLKVKFSNTLTGLSVTSLKINGKGAGSFTRTAQNTAVSGTEVTVNSWTTSIDVLESTAVIVDIILVMSDGKTYQAQFPESTVVD